MIFFRYLPPYTSFLPIGEEDGEVSGENCQRGSRRRIGLAKSLQLPQLSYLVICICAICITERKNLSQDPINFSVLNIVIEVIRQVSIPISKSFLLFLEASKESFSYIFTHTNTLWRQSHIQIATYLHDLQQYYISLEY